MINFFNKFILFFLFLSLTNNLFSQNNSTDSKVFSPRANHKFFVFKNKLYVVGGDYSFRKTEKIFFNDIWVSENGMTWVRIKNHFLEPPRNNFSLEIFDNKVWIFGGYYIENDQYLRDIWYSEDMLNWIKVEEFAVFPGRMKSAITVFDNKIYLIGGVGKDYSLLSDVWVSSDGIEWEQISHDNPFSSELENKAVVFDNSLFLFSEKHGVFKSVDGKIWSVISDSKLFTTRRNYSIINNDESLYLIGGEKIYSGTYYTDFLNDIWSSSDGVEWKQIAPHFTSVELKEEMINQVFPRSCHSVTIFKDRFFITGGLNSNNSKITYLDDTWVSKECIKWLKMR